MSVVGGDYNSCPCWFDYCYDSSCTSYYSRVCTYHHSCTYYSRCDCCGGNYYNCSCYFGYCSTSLCDSYNAYVCTTHHSCYSRCSCCGGNYVSCPCTFSTCNQPHCSKKGQSVCNSHHPSSCGGGHVYGGYGYNSSQHWKQCTKCTVYSIAPTGHTLNKGVCVCGYKEQNAPTISGLTMDNSSYKKSHTATLTVKDTGGSYLKQGSYTVRYSWTTSTATPSSYASSTTLTVGANTNTASVNITGSGYNGTYYLHIKVEGLKDGVGNALGTTTKYVAAYFDNTAPTISGLTMDNTSYKKSHTATLTVKDTGGSYLKQGSYTVRYSWTTSTATPSSYASSTTLSVGANTNSASVNITGSGYTGIYYLHVKVEGLTDTATNALGTSTKYVQANFDNILPTMSMTMDNASYQKSHTATLSVADTGGSYLKQGSYTVRYSWTTSTATPSSYASSTTLSVGANTNSASVNITGSGYTGIYYLHVKVEGLTDTATNALATSTTYLEAKFDNNAPTMSLTMDNTSYAKSHTATVSIAETGGSYLKQGNYTVRYSWTTSTSTPSSYEGSTTLSVGASANSASVNISGNGYTGVYYLHVKVEGLVDNANNAVNPSTKYVQANFDNTAPTISLNIDKTTYEKSHTVTFTLNDVGGSHLKTGNYTLEYSITQSSSTPSSYESGMAIGVGVNADTITQTFTKNTDNGKWYLHVRIKNITDNALNELNPIIASIEMKMDNTSPIIETVNRPNRLLIDSEGMCEIPLIVTDNHAGTEVSSIDENDIIVYVGGVESTATKNLAYSMHEPGSESYNGKHTYKLILSNITETGWISLKIPANVVEDRATNQNAETSFDIERINIFVDNERPIITQNGEYQIKSLNNLSGIIDKRYISKEYEIEIPLLLTDIGTGKLQKELETGDITVKIDDVETVVALSNLETKSENVYEDQDKKIKTYQKEYILRLKGIEGNGYLSISVPDECVKDEVDHTNMGETFVQHTLLEDGTTSGVYVDNFLPIVRITAVSEKDNINSETELVIDIQVVDDGAGIREDEFKAEDIDVQVNGSSVRNIEKNLVPDANNNHETKLGNDVDTNYSYTLTISKINVTGVIRLSIPTHSIIDKANNGNEDLTLMVETIADNEGPKVGTLKVENKNDYDRVIGEGVKLIIDNCTDDSGIAKYEWQVSDDGVNFETFEEIDSMLPSSKAEHKPEEEKTYYYKVIVSDSLGNSTESNVVKIEYLSLIDRKITVRFETSQQEAEKVNINVIIKSTAQIAEILVNNSKVEKEKYKNVEQINKEFTTTLDYVAYQNGVYKFKVTDVAGNVTEEEINISTIIFKSAVIIPEPKNATMLAPAQIKFKSNQMVRIKNPENYENITFDTTSYATIITATIAEEAGYIKDMTFEFENRGFLQTDVLVEGPVLAKVSYIRFANEIIEPIEITAIEAKALSQYFLSSYKTIDGKTVLYHGMNERKPDVKLATTEEFDVVEILSGASEMYTLGKDGTNTKLLSEENISVKEDLSYINGNITGMYEKTDGLLDVSSSQIENNLNIYDTFRVILIP